MAITIISCFLAGFEIAAPEGPRVVETLAVGDLVTTADGRVVPVKFLDVQTVSTLFAPVERLRPVCVSESDLGPRIPYVDHALSVDDVLCHAGALVNGETISYVPLPRIRPEYKVYHIETEAHEVIVANGAPAETFIDHVSRRVLDNFADYEALYGAEQCLTELPYSRAMTTRQVPNRIWQLTTPQYLNRRGSPSPINLWRASRCEARQMRYSRARALTQLTGMVLLG